MVHPIIWSLGLLTVLTGGLAVLAWRQQPQPGSRAFAMMTVGITWWTGTMTVGHVLRAHDLWAAFVFLTRVEWIGMFVMAASWFVFALAYTGRSEYANRRTVGLLLIGPGLVYPLAFTNYLIVNAAGSVVGLSPGLPPSFDPWLAVEPAVVAYIYALVAVSSLLLLEFLFTSRLPHPEQAILWLVAVVVPWVVNALYVTGVIPALGPFDVDPTPFGFVALIGIGLVAMRQYDAFGVAPVARAYVVDQLDTGVVVYDRAGRLIDANEWTRSVLGLTDRARGDAVWAVLPLELDETRFADADSTAGAAFTERIDGETLEIDTGAGQRTFSIDASVLERPYPDETDVVDGYALVIRDVTVRRRRKRALETQNQQLELVSRLVNHDIRNEMNTVIEIASHLEREADSGDASDLGASVEQFSDQLRQRGERTVELTERASELVRAVEETAADPEPVALRRTLEREVVNASTLSADATVVVDGDVPDVPVLANEMLSSVFNNLLTNAVQHNDATEPVVVVSATATDDHVTVRIADNGPGIPDRRKATVFDQATSLDSDGSGLGLYLVGTLVDQYGGEVWIEDRSAGDVWPTDRGEADTAIQQRVAGPDGRDRDPADAPKAVLAESSGTVFVVKLKRA